MTEHPRLSRRTLLKTAATGAAALALSDVVPAAARSPRAPVTINFWGPGGDPLGGPYIRRLVNEFNNTVGKSNNIFVNNHYISADNNYVKYTTGMTSTSSPDVVMTYAYDPVLPWIVNGFVQPMDTYAAQLGMKQADFVNIGWDMQHVNGHIWCLAQEFDFDEFYWNTQIHHGEAPKTIAELDALAARYNIFDKNGHLVQAGLIPWVQGGWTDWAPLWGASFYDQTSGKWTINTPQNQKFLDWMLKYAHMFGGRAKADALVSSAPTTYRDLFLYGKTAFAMEGEYLPTELVPLGLDKKLHYGISNPPTVPGVTGKYTVITQGGNVFLLPTRAQHPQEAAIFIKWMVSPHALLEWALGIGQMLPSKASLYSAAFSHGLPWIKPWVADVQADRVQMEPLSPSYPVFSQAITVAIDAVTYMRQTPAQALADLDRKVSNAVQQFKQTHPNWPTD